MDRSRKRLGLEALAALLWCVLTLATDRLFFRYDWKTPYFFVYKALFVLLAFAVVHGAVTLGARSVKRMPSCCVGCNGCCPICFLRWWFWSSSWPGCWGSDDLDVLHLARWSHRPGSISLPVRPLFCA